MHGNKNSKGGGQKKDFHTGPIVWVSYFAMGRRSP